MRAIRHASNKDFILYARISHIYDLVSIGKLARTLKTFVAYLFKCQTVEGVDDTFILMSGHFVV